MSLKKNILGRVYQHGIGLSVDLRSSIIQELIENGRNCVTGKVSRGVFSRVAKKFKVRVKMSAKYGNDTSKKVHIPHKCDIKKEDQNLPNLTKS